MLISANDSQTEHRRDVRNCFFFKFSIIFEINSFYTLLVSNLFFDHVIVKTNRKPNTKKFSGPLWRG